MSVIEEIKRVEQECHVLLEESEKERTTLISQSKDKCKALWETHQEKWNVHKAKKLAKHAAEIEQEKKKIEKEGEKKIRALERISPSKREKAIKFILSHVKDLAKK